MSLRCIAMTAALPIGSVTGWGAATGRFTLAVVSSITTIGGSVTAVFRVAGVTGIRYPDLDSRAQVRRTARDGGASWK